MKTISYAIITGAAKGIGLEVAHTLSKSGYFPILIDQDSRRLSEAIKGFPASSVKGYECDVADEASVRSVCEAITGLNGTLSLLVNNAGIMIRKPIEELSYMEWNKVLAVNTGSIFLFSKYLGPTLRKNHASIINISSTRAHMSEANTESYSASKGAILALTHALAISMGPDVTVNAISPGWIDSRDPDEKSAEPLDAEDHAQHPSGRVGTPADIASMVLWLADPRNRFVTGQEFIIDGGMTRKMIYR